MLLRLARFFSSMLSQFLKKLVALQPVYRVFRMLEKVWACLIFQMIAQILTSVFQIPHCGATAADAHYFVFRSLS